MNLFKANTIAQYKIGTWLAKQGVTKEDVSAVTLVSADTITITNPAGQFMNLRYVDGSVKIV